MEINIYIKKLVFKWNIWQKLFIDQNHTVNNIVHNSFLDNITTVSSEELVSLSDFIFNK